MTSMPQIGKPQNSSDWQAKGFIRKGLIVFLALCTGAGAEATLTPVLPENPLAFGQCSVKVRVYAARVRQAPNLDAPIMELRYQSEELFVSRVDGKWAQIITSQGDTAYMAAYLLNFPTHGILDQWKRGSPEPTVGKKAKIKWARLPFRKYPSLASPTLGLFGKDDIIAVVSQTKKGWSFVQCKGGEFGFVPNRALESLNEISGTNDLVLSSPQCDPEEIQEPLHETPGEYYTRKAWSPRLFALQNHQPETSPYLAMR